MSEEVKINARCPLCGFDFYTEIKSGNVICPSCNKEVSAAQAVKYLQSVTESPEIAKEAHGEDYHKVRMMLDEAHGLCLLSRFDEAETKIEEALSLTETDYRVYMAMVEVKTKNYTDLSDETHKPYIDKAISVADAEERTEIKRLYKNYYEKRRFTAEELWRYTEETRKDTQKRLEGELKSIIPTYMAMEKRFPLLLVSAIITLVLGIGLFALSVVIENVWLSFGGLILAAGCYVLFHATFASRESCAAFNALLDLYDEFEKVAVDDEKSIKLYKIMTVLAEKFSLNVPVTAMSAIFDELINAIIDLNDSELNSFTLGHKYFGKYVEEDEK